MSIYSYEPFGYEGSLVLVEADIRDGIPAIDMVGFSDGAVRECRERMKSAIRNSAFEFPAKRVLISLAPADLKKDGAHYDLPIALKILAESEGIVIKEPILVMGELELNGRTRHIRGVMAALSTAKMVGITKVILPKANSGEFLDGIDTAYVESLSEAFEILKNGFPKSKRVLQSETVDEITFSDDDDCADYADIIGHQREVRAMTVAAAGGHNILLYGEQGCGKTLLAQRLHSIIPDLRKDERPSVNRIYSLAGLRDKEIIRPPFRIPHQTMTLEGLCGGGPNCRPGEISLAHNGVLFLDEAMEFRANVLQMLRVPLESGSVTLSRAGRSTVYPANFQLVMTAKTCPCGKYGSKGNLCLCSTRSIDMYWKKVSSPLLDRIEMKVRVENIYDDDKVESTSTSSAEIRKLVKAALEIQYARQGKKNSRLMSDETARYCIGMLTEDAKALFDSIEYSPRCSASVLKLARTIADIRKDGNIQKCDIEEALTYTAGISGSI